MKKFLFVFAIFFSFAFIYAQNNTVANSTSDKYSAMPFMISQIFECSEGVVVKYITDKGDIKTTYLPFKFFRDGTVVRVTENDTKISPQMSVVFKNLKQFKVKLYLAENQSNNVYRIIDTVTPTLREKFNINELQIEM